MERVHWYDNFWYVLLALAVTFSILTPFYDGVVKLFNAWVDSQICGG